MRVLSTDINQTHHSACLRHAYAVTALRHVHHRLRQACVRACVRACVPPLPPLPRDFFSNFFTPNHAPSPARPNPNPPPPVGGWVRGGAIDPSIKHRTSRQDGHQAPRIQAATPQNIIKLQRHGIEQRVMRRINQVRLSRSDDCHNHYNHHHHYTERPDQSMNSRRIVVVLAHSRTYK